MPLLLLASASASRAQLACHGGHAGRTRPHSSPGTSGHEAATPGSGATAAARRLRARPLARAWRVALWEGAILVLALQGTTRALERRNAPRPKTRSLASAFCGIVLDPAQGLPRRSHARRAVAPHRNRHHVCPAQSRPNASLRPLPGRQLQRRAPFVVGAELHCTCTYTPRSQVRRSGGQRVRSRTGQASRTVHRGVGLCETQQECGRGVRQHSRIESLPQNLLGLSEPRRRAAVHGEHDGASWPCSRIVEIPALQHAGAASRAATGRQPWRLSGCGQCRRGCARTWTAVAAHRLQYGRISAAPPSSHTFSLTPPFHAHHAAGSLSSWMLKPAVGAGALLLVSPRSQYSTSEDLPEPSSPSIITFTSRAVAARRLRSSARPAALSA